MEELIMYDVENVINKALNNKTLIPRMIYNIQLDYSKLDYVVDKLFIEEVVERASGDDLVSCRELLVSAAHKGICKNLLAFGLPLVDNSNFKDTFTSSVLLWVETSTNNHSFGTLVNFDNEEVLSSIQNEILNILEKLTKDLKELDNDIIDVSDFFTYNSHDYVSINDCVMYKSIQDKVISILRF